MSDKHEHSDAENQRHSISRRTFIKVAGGVLATAAGLTAAGCNSIETAPAGSSSAAQVAHSVIPVTEIPVADQYPEVPYPPTAIPAVTPAGFKVLTKAEAALVEAITARILPGDANDPGAREAGVVYYIDNVLSFNNGNGFTEPTYRSAPFAQTYEGDQPPATGNDPSQVVWVAKDQLARYGFQSNRSPQEMYRTGLAELDRYSTAKFGASFVKLTEAQQDDIVADLADGKATDFDQPSAKDFFSLLRNDTINGMFSDPVYGGNRNMVGWKLLGYPGAQRAYTSQELKTEGHMREPQSLAMMHEFHAGQPANGDVILPVSGSEEHRQDQLNHSKP